jgi:hypothetical protein
MFCFNLFPSYKLFHPNVPFLVELSDQNRFCVLIADRMVDGVIVYELEVPEGPVIGYSGEEVVYGGIVDPEFTGIVRVYGDSVTQPKQDRS